MLGSRVELVSPQGVDCQRLGVIAQLQGRCPASTYHSTTSKGAGQDQHRHSGMAPSWEHQAGFQLQGLRPSQEVNLQVRLIFGCLISLSLTSRAVLQSYKEYF